MKITLCITFLIFVTLVIGGCTGFQESHGEATTPLPQTRKSTEATTPFDIGDGGLLSNEPCGPPCFLGVEPGKTSQLEASQILTRLGIIDLCGNIDYFEKITKEWIGGWLCLSNFSITFRKSTGIVDFVRFEPSKLFTLQDIIATYGYPDFVVVLDTGIPEYPSTQASIYYSDLRMVLPLGEEQEGVKYEINQATIIEVVGYLEQQFIEKDFETFRDELYPWKGYGSYP